MAFTTSTLAEKKNKVLFILGATGTGKTKLSINLGTHFPAEIINSDKIQVYKGLDIATNKVPESERCSIPHHILGIIDDPEYDFTMNDFCNHVLESLDLITGKGHLPIIVGGSNSYLKKLVEDPAISFLSKYDCCFIWVDVSLPTLYQYVGKRVDEMVQAGMVDEIREYFVPGADNTKGIRRAIGVPELDSFFAIEKKSCIGDAIKEKILKEAIENTKQNTCILAKNQLSKIQNMARMLGSMVYKIDSTEVFEALLRGEDYKHVHQESVIKPSKEIVKRFLEETTDEFGYEKYSNENGKHAPNVV
ncbi:putative transferase [Medicago truncatula]|uniref:adenylate dimethylallyltransferase (ADP/ATP-dependent) n=1 Tax=Medicago truncatula TaxID=3880 RepID=A0A072TXU1_MEDTR|nr:adenylate isopentenyltransferase 5, chloroplastic [Medicago truncatula]KEH21991.1 adenylate isopentenyltransferase [Medicago truncatula]RHN44959.1 putative transferase [Medicago truncatula]